METRSLRKTEFTRGKSPLAQGKRKSGRVWKAAKGRASGIVRKPSKNSQKAAMSLRKTRSSTKELSTDLIGSINGEAASRREKAAEKKELKLANTRKAEIVQVVSSPAKIKRMKKKQLRSVVKRDTEAAVKSVTGGKGVAGRRQLRSTTTK